MLELYALLAAMNKTLHAYGVRDQMAYDSASRIIVAMGTLYPLLKRLVRRGLLQAIEAESNVACRYVITEKGRQYAAAEVRRLDELTAQVRYKLSYNRGTTEVL